MNNFLLRRAIFLLNDDPLIDQSNSVNLSIPSFQSFLKQPKQAMHQASCMRHSRIK